MIIGSYGWWSYEIFRVNSMIKTNGLIYRLYDEVKLGVQNSLSIYQESTFQDEGIESAHCT